MNRLRLTKRNDSFVAFADGQRLFAGSSYEVRVEAGELAEDVTSPRP